jgi:hypothetical protein
VPRTPTIAISTVARKHKPLRTLLELGDAVLQISV